MSESWREVAVLGMLDRLGWAIDFVGGYRTGERNGRTSCWERRYMGMNCMEKAFQQPKHCLRYLKRWNTGSLRSGKGHVERFGGYSDIFESDVM